MITFTYDDYGKIISYKTDEVSKYELMQDFASFLKAVGFSMDGELVDLPEDYEEDLIEEAEELSDQHFYCVTVEALGHRIYRFDHEDSLDAFLDRFEEDDYNGIDLVFRGTIIERDEHIPFIKTTGLCDGSLVDREINED